MLILANVNNNYIGLANFKLQKKYSLILIIASLHLKQKWIADDYLVHLARHKCI